MKTLTVKTKRYGVAKLVIHQYPNNGRICILLLDGQQLPIATLTVNIPDKPLKEGEFFVKTWSENQEIAKDCLASGHFINTGRQVQTGYVMAQVWKFKE